MISAATANLGNRPDSVVLRGLIKLSKEVDVIGFQEAGDRGRMLTRFCDATGWVLFAGDSEGAPSVAIAWNPNKVLTTHAGTRPCTEPTDCGDCGVGPEVVKAKVWNKVRIHPRNGGVPFVFINGHLPASLHCPCRRRLAEIMAEELVDMFMRRIDEIGVLAVMDGNSSGRDRLWKDLRALGAKQKTWFPTHGRRIIDLGWALKIKVKARRFKGKYSDHTWVIFRVG